MKKLISLLLVLVLSLGMLTGISMAAEDYQKPDECTQAEAEVLVTDGEGGKYYFPTLSAAVVQWAGLKLPGAKTIQLLKDVVLDPANGAQDSSYFLFPAGYTNYYGNDLHKNPVIFDLGGHTMQYDGEGMIWSLYRYGITIKNGTVLYNGTTGRSMIGTSATTGQIAFSNGQTQWEPIINLEDLNVVNNSESGCVMINNVWGAKITIKNCQLVSVNKKTALNLYASDQSKISGTPWEGDYTGVCTIENSVIASNGTYAFGVKRDEQTVKFTDSLVISNGKTEAMYDPKSMPQIVGDAAALGQWTGTVAGQEITGNAYVIGKNPLKVELPFEDVKEGDWFFDFVAEMYGKKIIAGQTATTFNPNGNLTYGAALKLLTVGVTGKDAGNAASGHWATNYLNEAVAAGWTTIGADKLDAPVTREAFCEIAAKAKNLTEKAENPFKDTTNDAVLALVKAGVISGMSADTFAPQGVLTRAQIAKIISLLIKL